MPIGSVKNHLYGLALPLIGLKCEWHAESNDPLQRILKKHHTVGACIQRFENGALADCRTVGYARLDQERIPVTAQTFFRTASISKMVVALLVFRLQTLGKLSVSQPIGELLGYPVVHPGFPRSPITLGMLLSHTSGLTDSQAYYASFQAKTPLKTLLDDASSYLPIQPGSAFHYSNFAAGIVGSILERHTGMCLEALAQKELFEPLHVRATFDAATLPPEQTADSYRVLPSALAFDARRRIASSEMLRSPNPEQHYLLAAGNLFISGPDLGRLAIAASSGCSGFLNADSLKQLHTPLHGWPEKKVPMRHGMGLLTIQDPSIHPGTLWGHQGFAYGAVNGVFFDQDGNGFVSLNSGASERRTGHLALLNRDLIAWGINAQRSDG